MRRTRVQVKPNIGGKAPASNTSSATDLRSHVDEGKKVVAPTGTPDTLPTLDGTPPAQECVKPAKVNDSGVSVPWSDLFQTVCSDIVCADSTKPIASADATDIKAKSNDIKVESLTADIKLPCALSELISSAPVQHSNDESEIVHHQQKASGTALSVRAGRFHVKPNIAKNARVRQISVSDKLEVVASSVTLTTPQHSSETPLPDVPDSEPFIPPLLSPVRPSPSCMDVGVESEEVVVTAEQPQTKEHLTAEKAAAKMIERRMQQKKKRRQLLMLQSPIDRTKICMRDLIYLNPVNNPLKSPTEAEKVTSQSRCVKLPDDTPASSTGGDDSDTVLPDDDENIPVPQVKVGPDGKIVLNLETVVIEEKQSTLKIESAEVVDETNLIRRGYPKKSRSRPWDRRETRKFYSLLSRIGTDFSLMCRLFTDRSRVDLKRKFKREEKIHRDLVEKVLGERKGLDITLLAEPSSDEEESPPPKKRKRNMDAADENPAMKRGARRNKKTKNSLTEKENTLQSVEPDVESVTATMSSSKLAFKKGRKKGRNLYYEESSESESEEQPAVKFPVKQAATSQSATGPSSRDAAVVSSPTCISSDDEDEVQVIQAICGKPTRSGRVPRIAIPMSSSSDCMVDPTRVVLKQSKTEVSTSSSPSATSKHCFTTIRSPSHSASYVCGSPPRIANSTVRPLPSSVSTVSTSAGFCLPQLPSDLFVLVERPNTSSSTSNQSQSLFHIFALSTTPQGAAGPADAQQLRTCNDVLVPSLIPAVASPGCSSAPHCSIGSLDIHQLLSADNITPLLRPAAAGPSPIRVASSDLSSGQDISGLISAVVQDVVDNPASCGYSLVSHSNTVTTMSTTACLTSPWIRNPLSPSAEQVTAATSASLYPVKCEPIEPSNRVISAVKQEDGTIVIMTEMVDHTDTSLEPAFQLDEHAQPLDDTHYIDIVVEHCEDQPTDIIQ